MPAQEKVPGVVRVLQLLWALGMLPWAGFVMSMLWAWFVSDTFGIREISIGEAIGLVMLVTFVRYRWRPDTDTLETIAGRMASMLTAPAMSLLLGYLVHLVVS